MIGKIDNNTKLECLNCGKTIVVEGNLLFDLEGEYIKCPHCNHSYDVQEYHIHGKLVDETTTENHDERVDERKDERKVNNKEIETIIKFWNDNAKVRQEIINKGKRKEAPLFLVEKHTHIFGQKEDAIDNIFICGNCKIAGTISYGHLPYMAFCELCGTKFNGIKIATEQEAYEY